jgi:hypothetical protein
MKRPCGCCSGIQVLTPEPEANRPGLSAISYRAGTHASFLESMLARITTLYLDVPISVGSQTVQRIFPLAGLVQKDPNEFVKAGSALSTRERNDPSIALMDAWATLADVITFYQERIANEGFLRTATERRSILELAKLVGYKLRPGVSSSVYLAFTVNDGFNGVVPKGTRAQSIPGTGERPQFFETYEDLAARDVWNKLKPRLTRPQVITLATDDSGQPIQIDPGTDAATRDTLYFKGISTNLKTGDVLLIVAGNGPNQQVVRTIKEVELQPDPTPAKQDRTEVTLVEPPFSATGSPSEIVTNAVQPFIHDASAIFENSAVASQVAQILKDLRKSVTANPESAADQVTGILPKIEEIHDAAESRKFTRLEPWLQDLVDTLNALIQSLAGTSASVPEGGVPDTVKPVPIKLSLTASPLQNLVNILKPLSKPPSLQPANTFQLPRTVREAFAPASDIAPRLLGTFHPAAAGKLYKAWSGVAAPVARVEVYAMRAKSGLFGNNAPKQAIIPPPQGGNIEGSDSGSDGSPVKFQEWTLTGTADAADGTTIHLETPNDKVLAGSWMVVDTSAVGKIKVVPSPGLLYAKAGAKPQDVSSVTRADYGMSGKTTRIKLTNPETSAPVKWFENGNVSDKLENHDFLAIRNTVVYAQPERLDLAEEPLDVDIEGDHIELQYLYDGLDSGRWIIVSGERTDIANTSGVTASELVMVSSVVQGSHAPNCAVFPGALIPPVGQFPFSQIYYTTDPNLFGDRLIVGELGVDPNLLLQTQPSKDQPPNPPNQQYCDQVQLAQGVYVNAYVPSAAELEGNFDSTFIGLLVDPSTRVPYEKATLPVPNVGGVFAWRISTQPVHTILKLAKELAYTYDADTVNIYANVVKATHGQTQGEVLGNGDSSQSLQEFPLHQSPLTYLPAPIPSGAESTLSLRVNEVEWHEADNLFELGPTDREYTTVANNSGQTKAITGNGEHGSRVPTGTANVKAVYRSGTGKVGNVQAEQISQLATQPLGVKSVINPLPAGGGADGDTRDQARRNIPIGTLALDRLVSVVDYADFTRKFAGIAKASALRLSDGRKLLVHLTIAGKDDVLIDPTTDLYKALLQALYNAGDPNQPLQIALRRLKVLVINAGIKVQADYLWEFVAPRIRAALLDLYSFENRELGQSAFRSEAVSAAQAVEGVEYVDMRSFDSIAESVTAEQLANLAGTLTLKPLVEAELAQVNSTERDPAKRISPAELVILTPDIPDTLILTEITA